MKGFIKIGGIYFDTKPIEGSNNAVTSDGIAKAIKEGSISYDDTELRNRITQAESDIDTLETSVSEKATTASVTALSDRVTQISGERRDFTLSELYTTNPIDNPTEITIKNLAFTS